ncbi:hypothetical protein AU476_39290 [Cupriavidus sp. UYMSc13B]|nr:hypothetical protein AU476_39290 [Cupriavidus sp. UYMSc13B]
MLAGFLIPAVAAHWGWRANFYVLAALGVLWAVTWLALGREGTLDDARRGTVAPTPPRPPARRRACHTAYY